MEPVDNWTDFETLRHGVKQNTVDKLKHIITGFNEECAVSISKTGRKQDHIDKIITQLDHWRQTNNVDKWTKARAVLYQVRRTQMYTSNRIPSVALVPPSAGPSITHGSYTSSKPLGVNTASAGPSGLPRYDPYAPPRKPLPATSSSSSSGPRPPIRFKPSPFFQIDQAVSDVVECPESTGTSDRKQQTVSFTLKNDQLSKLNSSSPKYQLRLFCTSSTFHSGGPGPFRNTSNPCPIEFPATCEVRVNNVQLSANLKGLKKKPGTAPPADLGKTVRLNTGTSNRVEMVYVNSQQPAISKKYYLIVMLVEVTTVDQLVDRLKKGKYRSSSDILTKMAASISEDEDIISGPQKMSLKCPLSFMRINTPCRSSQCVHPQCFDATSWFSVMEQTTTWLCPVCEKVLNYDELIIDGYFDEILRQVPDSVEDVMVEADGQWHTNDNKYASEAWKVSNPPQEPVKKAPTPRKPSPVKAPVETAKPSEDTKKAKANVEILILDSDEDEDEDEGRVKRELSPSIGSSSVLNGKESAPNRGGDVIDLTLDSDSEEPPVTRGEKRKGSDTGVASPTEQIWKKSRVDTSIPPTRLVNGQQPNGASSSSSPVIPFHSNGLRYPPQHTSHSPTDQRAPLSPGGRYSSTYPTYSMHSNYLPRHTPPPRIPPASNNSRYPPPPPHRPNASTSSTPYWS